MKKLYICMVAFFVLIACDSNAGEAFTGGSFKGRSDNGTDITIHFNTEENKVSGKIVNNFFGSYKLDGDNIKFSPIASTMMMGPEDKMAAERELFKFLEEAAFITVKDDKLVIKGSSGKEMTFEKKAE